MEGVSHRVKTCKDGGCKPRLCRRKIPLKGEIIQHYVPCLKGSVRTICLALIVCGVFSRSPFRSGTIALITHCEKGITLAEEFVWEANKWRVDPLLCFGTAFFFRFKSLTFSTLTRSQRIAFKNNHIWLIKSSHSEHQKSDNKLVQHKNGLSHRLSKTWTYSLLHHPSVLELE